MNPITLEEFHDNPELRLQLHRAARRERARLVHAGFVWLRDRLTPRIHLRPARWIARLG